MTGAKLNKIYTEFVFFKAFHDESTVGVVSSLVAGIMGDGAEWDRHPATLHYPAVGPAVGPAFCPACGPAVSGTRSGIYDGTRSAG